MALDNLPTSAISYLVFGEELAPTTGTPHLQGHVVFRQPHRRPSVTRYLTSRFALSVARKNSLANYRYCRKGSNIKIRDYRYGRNIDYRVINPVTSTSDPSREENLDRIFRNLVRNFRLPRVKVGKDFFL